MQALVYIFISLAGLAVAVAAYLGLAFTPSEALMAGLVFVSFIVVMLERTLRRRSEFRLERAIEDLSRLLSTDAQAGQVLSQRINAMTDVEAGPRLSALEGDVSVIGTVVQQVAEAVATLEDAQAQFEAKLKAASQSGAVPAAGNTGEAPATAPPPAKPTGIPVDLVRNALRDGRVIFQTQSIVSLPKRHICGYDLLPRLQLENGDVISTTVFNPPQSADDLVRELDRLAWREAFEMVQDARADKGPVPIYVPISRATLAHADTVEAIEDMLNTDRASGTDITFVMSVSRWEQLTATERAAFDKIGQKCAGISLRDANSLRIDFADLQSHGVTSVSVDASGYINQPDTYTDYHSSDVVDYIARYEIDLMVTGIHSEQQVLSVLEDGVQFTQGDHLARPGPIPFDLVVGKPINAPAASARTKVRRTGARA